MNHFIYYFDIAAIFIYLIIAILYRQQNLVKNGAHRLFIALWICSFITPIADIFSVLGIDWNMPPVFLATNTMYYLGLQWTAFFFFLYALSPLVRREKVRPVFHFLICVPITLVTILILLNIKLGWIFCYIYETDTYTYGNAFYLTFIPVTIYYGYSIYYVIKRGESYNTHIKHGILNTAFLVVAFVVFQALFPKYLVHAFAISLALLQLLIVTINVGITQDPITKMLSKNAFYDSLNNLIYNKVNFNVVAVRFADFEVMLSTYGIQNLKSLETEISNEVAKNLPKDRCYKLSDDIYCVLFNKESPEEVEDYARKIDNLLTSKWTINGIDISFSHFVVTFNFPKHFKSVTDFMGLVIYLQKTRRMRYGIMPVEEFAIRDLHREQDVEHAINIALKEGGFEVFYQPIYDTKKRRFVSAEALIRLNNSILGPIGPDEFIPISEKSGQIIHIGDFVLEEVCKFISGHDMEALGIEYIEVNLSAIQCLQRNFFVNLMSITKNYGIKPSQLCFEITETASNCAPEIFIQNLQCLHDAGFKLALDDFGTGYGNLQRLISMDFDIVKFDRKVTNQICTDSKIRPIFDKMIVMLHSMHVTIVSEGVETKSQLDFLSGLTTDYIQGYYFSKAIPADEYIKYIKENKEC